MPSPAHDHRFVQLIDQANAVTIDGWHFSFLQGRVASTPLPWDYEGLAKARTAAATRVLDVDTGGGEVLARLQPPAGSVAVEDWPTNIPIAGTRLTPLSVEVRQRLNGKLPVEAASVDLVLNRHGDLDLTESARVLRPGGRLLTQQVAPENESEIAQAFGMPTTMFPNTFADLAGLGSAATSAGLLAELQAAAVTVTRYLDVGALVLQLRAVSWQVPDFTTDAYRDVLWRIHCQIEDTGSFDVHSRRLLLEAHRPS